MLRRLLLVVLALFVGLFFYRAPSAAALPCSGPGAFIEVTFVNNTGGPVDVLWYSFSCAEVMYMDNLPAGRSYVQGTFVSHPWIVRCDDTQAVLTSFVATTTTTVTITGSCGGAPAAAAATPEPSQVFDDERINNFMPTDGGQPFAAYCNPVEGINVYGIDGESHGTLWVHVDYATIEAVGVPVDEHHLFAEQNGVSVWRLTTGEFQINGTYQDGKGYVLIWEGCPAVNGYLTPQH